ncbi:uncharacterized protein LOC141655965 [Silene latifolia]|uniref:uncharacterized protein LOC141655965 n=1 Tax=Silene latifolia TaxID=37657 RepID=UPI003D77586A
MTWVERVHAAFLWRHLPFNCFRLGLYGRVAHLVGEGGSRCFFLEALSVLLISFRAYRRNFELGYARSLACGCSTLKLCMLKVLPFCGLPDAPPLYTYALYRSIHRPAVNRSLRSHNSSDANIQKCGMQIKSPKKKKNSCCLSKTLCNLSCKFGTRCDMSALLDRYLWCPQKGGQCVLIVLF